METIKEVVQIGKDKFELEVADGSGMSFSERAAAFASPFDNWSRLSREDWEDETTWGYVLNVVKAHGWQDRKFIYHRATLIS